MLAKEVFTCVILDTVGARQLRESLEISNEENSFSPRSLLKYVKASCFNLLLIGLDLIDDLLQTLLQSNSGEDASVCLVLARSFPC